MLRRPLVLFVALTSWMIFLTPLRGEIVDKIAAVVDGRIITLSDIRKEHQIESAFDVPAQTDEETLNSLIDQHLMEEDMSQYPGLDVTDDEVDDYIKKTITDKHGLSDSDLRAAVVRKIQRANYVYQRFGQFIVVSNEEIEAYYKDNLVPEMKQRGLMPPELSQVSMDIQKHLREMKMIQENDDSLKEVRNRSTTRIEIPQ